MLHISPFTFNPGRGDWITSCAELPVLLDPTFVYGELTTESIHVSATRLHVFLSPAAELAVKKIKAGEIKPPALLPETSETETVPPPEPESISFDVNSFARRSLSENVSLFMAGLLNAYKDKGWNFVAEDGSVLLGKDKWMWGTVVSHIPGYFLNVLKNYAGFKFSHQVHNQLTQLLPTRPLLALGPACGVLQSVHMS